MNRRSFLRTFGLFVFLFVILPTSWFISACSGDTIKGVLNTVIAAIRSIIGVTDPNAAWYQPLVNALAAVIQAETQWQAGGAVVLIDDALNTVSAVLAVIPLTAQYAPLIALLVAGIESLLALIPQPTAVTPAARVSNPYLGQATLTPPHLFQTRAGAFREQWGKKAVEIGFPQAKI